MAVEQYVEASLFDALCAAKGVKADGYEKCRVHQILSGLPFPGQVVAKDDPSERNSNRHDRGRGVERPDVLEHVVQVVVLGSAVGAGSGDRVPPSAAKVENNAAGADLAVGDVDKTLDVLRL